MSNIVKVSNGTVKEVEVSNKLIEFKKNMLSLIKFDIDELDVAKVVYFRKKDCIDPQGWFDVVVDGLGLYRTHHDIKFDVKVTDVEYSEKTQKYEIYEHKIRNIKGKDIAAHCYNTFRDINFADLIRIDATAKLGYGKRYNISCVFARNDI